MVDGSLEVFDPHLELLNVLGPSSDPGPNLCSGSLPCLSPQSPALWVGSGRGEGTEMKLWKSGGSRGKRGECRFSNCLCLQLGKLLIIASHKGLKQEGLSFLLT